MTGFQTLDRMPDRVTSGDGVALALSDLSALYPPSAYALTVTLKCGADAPITLALSGNGGLHGGVLSFAGAAPGSYGYGIKARRLSDNATRTVESGTVIVNADPATQDTRSHAEKVLAAIEALIEGRATKADSSYSIAGRSLTRLTPEELVKWRNHYRAEVMAQRRAGQPNGGRRITYASFK